MNESVYASSRLTMKYTLGDCVLGRRLVTTSSDVTNFSDLTRLKINSF